MQETPNRLEKLEQLKKKLVSFYGSCLLKVDESRQLEILRKTDTPEQRQQKIEINRQIVAEREELYRTNEAEMLEELEKIISRIEAQHKSSNASQPTTTDSIDAPSGTLAYGSHLSCSECKNKDRNFFYTDPFSGDVICEGIDGRGCGTVVVDHEIFSGAEKRNFENEEDRNHYGPAPNKLMPDVVNMETSMLTTVNGRESAAFKRLAQTQHSIEMNLSTIGREDRHTRQGYKTKMKRQAFRLLEEIGGNVNLHQAVINRAKERFSEYRDEREAMHNFEGSVLACLALSYAELSRTTQLDVVPRSYTVSVDVGGLTAKKLLPPRDAVTDDAAISACPSCSFGQLHEADVSTWLQAVASSAPANWQSATHLAVEHLLSSLRVQLREEEEKERQRREAGEPSSKTGLFGMTTVRQRRQYYSSATSSSSASGMPASTPSHSLSSPAMTSITAGRLVLRWNILALLRQSKVLVEQLARQPSSTPMAAPSLTLEQLAGYFKAALLRRTQYDQALLAQEEALAAERKRLRTEENNSVPQKKRQLEEYRHRRDFQHGSASQDTMDSSREGEAREDSNSSGSLRTSGGESGERGASTTSSQAGRDGEGEESSSKSLVEAEGLQLVEVDLEDLIGGAVTVLPSSSQSLAPPAAQTFKPRAAPAPASATIAPVSGSVAVKVEKDEAAAGTHGPATSSAGALHSKKVGARPRPKIVLT